MYLGQVWKMSLIFIDVCLIQLSTYLILSFKYGVNWPIYFGDDFLKSVLPYSICLVGLFYLFKLYKSLWQYASISELLNVLKACVIGGLMLFLVINPILHINFDVILMPFYILLLVFFIGGIRFAYRVVRRDRRFTLQLQSKSKWKNVLIVGGGDAGSTVIRELQINEDVKLRPVGVIDDDKSKQGRTLHGVDVVGTRHDIVRVVEEKNVDEILVSIPSMNGKEMKQILDICQKTPCKLKTMPGLYQLINGEVDIRKIRDVEIEDLLGRDPVETNLEEISNFIHGKVVLVTGGGGSIGSELCRQIASFNPKTLIIVDIYENSAYDIQNELKAMYGKGLDLKVIIASVRDFSRIRQIFKQYHPQIVYHAAAHKHVPLMEASPQEAIKNNVFGTLNVAKCAHEFKVSRFVLISTDKAVNPTNIMGASKRLAEMIIQSLNEHSRCEYVAVRFGNVLGSNGSVIPLFKRQIENGGPITVTHPDIIRYFMTIPEAVELVLQAGAMARGGEVFVLDMGEPVKIVDLAKGLIRLSGLELGKDIDIKYTGLRPGEKMFEELLLSEEGLLKTANKKIFIGRPPVESFERLQHHLDQLKCVLSDDKLVRERMKEIVTTYKEPDHHFKKELNLVVEDVS
ncbi:NAD-dependent epimerase/dehydratase family protein [Turicibacter sanguinis]|nr:NAD-dependent epimerase/dehydratase family protein [Turicibacter sanguinis]MTN50440.1 NAD-dependent epimerase/dehydratase family protein [Turicibacter sanguinis]MTN53652.1 NAD-dependent epimerase/dehydratase family protein [Turicibacter sanguinis]MTN56723.1 NAD-dependent epimerase/dehydratase family protein [Turicibacter sanguinis]MTN59788.1 NAD-dependent epimerase/dehydratase family protein [Turicibacter sanguinis]